MHFLSLKQFNSDCSFVSVKITMPVLVGGKLWHKWMRHLYHIWVRVFTLTRILIWPILSHISISIHLCLLLLPVHSSLSHLRIDRKPPNMLQILLWLCCRFIHWSVVHWTAIWSSVNRPRWCEIKHFSHTLYFIIYFIATMIMMFTTNCHCS